MKKEELTNEIARCSKMSRAAAADQLDRMVEEILRRVRRGEPAEIPGLGTLRPGQEVSFEPTRKGKGKAAFLKATKQEGR